jgi:hypothetical protein
VIEDGQEVEVLRHRGTTPVRWDPGYIVVNADDCGWVVVKNLSTGTVGIAPPSDVRVREK